MNTLTTLDYNGTELVVYENKQLTNQDPFEDRYVAVRDAYGPIGYAHQDQLTQLIRRHADEFEVLTTTVKMTVVEGGITKQREITMLNYEGLILATMLAKTPQAKEFRKWARGVLRKELLKAYSGEGATGMLGDNAGNKIMNELMSSYELLDCDTHPFINFRTLEYYYIKEGWVPDQFIIRLPWQFKNRKAFDAFIAQCGLPAYGSYPAINAVTARNLTRDHVMKCKSVDELAKEYNNSRRKIKRAITKTLHELDVVFKRFRAPIQIVKTGFIDWDYLRQLHGWYTSLWCWKNKRDVYLQIFDRCIRCDADLRLGCGEVHHIHYMSMGDENPLTDLLPLCKRCHKKIKKEGTDKPYPELVVN